MQNYCQVLSSPSLHRCPNTGDASFSSRHLATTNHLEDRGSFSFDFLIFFLYKSIFLPLVQSPVHTCREGKEISKRNSSCGIKNVTFLMTPLIRVYISTPCRGKNLINTHHKANCDKSGGTAAGNLAGATASVMFLLQKHDTEKL